MGLPRTQEKGKKPKISQTMKPTKITQKSLPTDLLMEVLHRVASSSFTDLFNAKLCCRDFLGAADNDYIFEHISIDKFPVIPWFTRDEEIAFMNRCKDKGNPEALFRQGMVEYFSCGRTELGVEYLKRAMEKGHAEASYVNGIILVARGDKSTRHSMEVLNSLKARSKPKTCFKTVPECRERTKAVIRTMWINNNVVRQLNNFCKDEACCVNNGGSWNVYEEEDDEVVCCDACRWYREVIWFRRMLTGKNS